MLEARHIERQQAASERTAAIEARHRADGHPDCATPGCERPAAQPTGGVCLHHSIL